MAYNKEEIFKQALEIAQDQTLKCIFLQDVSDRAGISKETFYRFFPIDSKEYDAINAAIKKNKIEIKTGLRSKWYKSNAPATQIALYKLIGNDEELKRLTQAQIDVTTKGESLNLSAMTTEELKERALAMQSIEGQHENKD